MMTKKHISGLILTLLLTLLAFSTVSAQQENGDFDNRNPRRGGGRPFKMMQELGLTPEQVQQIRQINQSRRPVMQEAARRWQTARRNLDAAVYADDSTEEQIKDLTNQAAFAQSELLKERTLTEYLVRKILTPDQLVKFRQLRAQLMERMDERKNSGSQDDPNNQMPRPVNRLQPSRKQNRPQ